MEPEEYDGKGNRVPEPRIIDDEAAHFPAISDANATLLSLVQTLSDDDLKAIYILIESGLDSDVFDTLSEEVWRRWPKRDDEELARGTGPDRYPPLIRDSEGRIIDVG